VLNKFNTFILETLNKELSLEEFGNNLKGAFQIVLDISEEELKSNYIPLSL
jgi:hypothetical protein